MKKYIIIMAAIIFLLPAVFVFSSEYLIKEKSDKSEISNQTQEAINNLKDKSGKKSCCAEEVEQGQFSEQSIFLDGSYWKDQNGNIIQLGKFKNKNVVMAMFFASCQSACPMIVNDMKKIEAVIPKGKLDEFKFVLVTIDPEHDNPGVLLKYAKDKNLDLQRWTLLTGEKNDVMELAMMLGFKFSKDANGGFMHTNLITFLNKKGEIVHQNTGLNVDINSIPGLITSLN